MQEEKFMVMRLRWVLGCGWLCCLLLCGGVSFGLAAEVNNPTAVVHRLVAAISGAQAASQGTLAGGGHDNGVVTPSVTQVIFDIPGVSQRTLGKHWKERSPAERQEFITLFEQLLSRVAFPKSAAFFHALDLTISDERIDGQKAVVKTTVRHPTEGNISIDYRLVQQDETWRVRDILLDDVSLATNLRSQFNQIITKHSYPELLRRMREKLTKAMLQAAR